MIQQKNHSLNGGIQYPILDTVEVFTTNVHNQKTAVKLIRILNNQLPDHAFNFDLEDRDAILRAETATGPVKTETIMRLVTKKGTMIGILTT